jgi:hypothetical protein
MAYDNLRSGIPLSKVMPEAHVEVPKEGKKALKIGEETGVLTI